MKKSAPYLVQKLKRRYFILRSVEIVVFSLAAALTCFALCKLLTSHLIVQIGASITVAAALAVVLLLRYRLHQLKHNFFTSYLNQKFPELNQSADLILLDESELSPLQQVLREKTLMRLNQIFPAVKLPHRVFQSFAILLGSVALYLLTSSFTITVFQTKFRGEREIRSEKDPKAIFITNLFINITPPVYTGLNSFQSDSFNLNFPENSIVRWSAHFSQPPTGVKIFFSGNDSVNLSGSNRDYSFHRNVNESGFYQIQWSDQTGVHRSDFYKIEVLKDQVPKLFIKGLDQFTKLRVSDRLIVPVTCELTDDYGITEAQLIATVSKGSGEGVKFREERLRFDSPQKITGKKLVATCLFDLKKIGLEPGDELYFYAEALDNMSPVSNKNRTETFFIAIQDTAKEITSVDSGMGVDLMPEYFRSQRQIIIDTEKLLRDKKKITRSQFNFTSNELGYDQKALRLRYGQFLGEEDESGISQHAENPEDEEENNDPLKKFSHQHDTKNEHNLVDQKKQPHQHNEELDNKVEDPIKDFVHQHDNSEDATFFIVSLKTKLKVALAQMWDAELYLRMYQPEKSLPYQYKALNLLKEISADSRIFVHRSGFDPPPLREERRLTADLSEIKDKSDSHVAKQVQSFPAIRDAIAVIEKMLLEKTRTLNSEKQNELNRAGHELSALATEQPVVFIKGLSLLKSLSENSSSLEESDLLELRMILFQALPSKTPSPVRQQGSDHSLNRLFLKNLERSAL